MMKTSSFFLAKFFEMDEMKKLKKITNETPFYRIFSKEKENYSE